MSIQYVEEESFLILIEKSSRAGSKPEFLRGKPINGLVSPMCQWGEDTFRATFERSEYLTSDHWKASAADLINISTCFENTSVKTF